ncbi:hypothetical protein IPM19_00720 [bacterium]|nr:MAG: hypothetical protein IPM19_00720 [bacterium]
MMKQITKARVAKIAASAAISVSLLAPSAAFAITANSDTKDSGQARTNKPIEFQGGPIKQKTRSIKDCQVDAKAIKETYRKAVQANDKTYAAAVKSSNQTASAATKAAAQARKTATSAAKSIKDKDARQAALKKAETDYKAATKAAKDAQKASKEAANQARKTANKTAEQSRDAALRNSGCVKGASTNGVFGRVANFFSF